MKTVKYEKIGRQEPIFFDPKAGAVRFVIENGEPEAIVIAVTYDPKESKRQLWEPYVGGLAGWLPGPPTGMCITLKQAEKPVFLCIEQEGEEEDVCQMRF